MESDDKRATTLDESPIEKINRYKKERLYVNGVWAKDTIFCILFCMEHRLPDYFDYEKLLQYERLVEIGAEFLKEHPCYKSYNEFLERALDDFYSFRKRLRSDVDLLGNKKVTEVYIETVNQCLEIVLDPALRKLRKSM